MKKNLSPWKHMLILAVPISTLFGLESCGKMDTGSAPSPTIISFTPASGTRSSFVLIRGNHFSSTASENTVTIHGIPAPVSAATPTSLAVIVPPGAGSGKIAVRVGNGADSSGNNFIYLIAISRFVGDGQFGSRDGQGSGAEFNLPAGAGIDALGNIYIADQDNHKIRKISPAGEVTTVAGSGTPGSADGPADQAQFRFPKDVAADASGNVYVADAYNNRIRKISPQGQVSTLAGNDTAAFADGPGSAAKFAFPSSVATDGAGNVYVADAGNNRIRKISATGSVTTIAGSGVPGFLDGAAHSAQFNGPSGIALDAAGNIYVGDLNNFRIRKITPAGEVSTLAGNGNQGFADGAPGIAEFASPSGIFADGSGNVYVADEGNFRVRKVSPDGTVSTVVGDGNDSPVDGPVSSAHLSSPTDLVIDASGTIYVIEFGVNLVRKIQ